MRQPGCANAHEKKKERRQKQTKEKKRKGEIYDKKLKKLKKNIFGSPGR